MARNSNYVFTFSGSSTFTINQSASSVVDIDLDSINQLRLMVEITYPAGTSSTTGVQVDLLYGFGGAADLGQDATAAIPHKYGPDLNSGAQGITFSDTTLPVTMAGFVPSAGAQTKRTAFFLNNPNQTFPRWCRVRFINSDASKPAVVKMYGDC